MGKLHYDIVSKLWNLCNVLKDDGVTYHQYVTELTYLLFLKMAKETGTETQIPTDYRWDDLQNKQENEKLEYYRILLIYLGNHGSVLVKGIFYNANSFIKKSSTLLTLIIEINKLEWFNVHKEGLGDLYEGLLEKNASEKKSGAGQYFTPRPLIESIVQVMRPALDDIIQDPAAGTGGFLIAASNFIKSHVNFDTLKAEQLIKYHQNTFYGMEHVQETQRLALMNMLLHEIGLNSESVVVVYEDTLSNAGTNLPQSTLIMTNPPFGNKKGGGLPDRIDLPFLTSNKQLCFLQHVYKNLKPGGRAAVIVPDNVLFDGNIGKQVRVDLMDKCNLHTILRLPIGIFYAQGVKTNVLFFTKGTKNTRNTQEVWVYDLRSNIPPFGKRNPLNRLFFKEFEIAFGNDPKGGIHALKLRKSQQENKRFRCFSREWIAERQDNLDIEWVRNENDHESVEPTLVLEEAILEIEGALEILREMMEILVEETEL